jgi:SOS-response transcriptional repressor LexA
MRAQEENSDFLNGFAFRLGTRADALGLSQADIAARLGAKAPRVNNWFKGKNLPRARERGELVKLLGCTSDWLFNGVGGPDQSSEKIDIPDGAHPIRSVPLISWAHAGAAATYDEMPKHWQGTLSSMSRDRRAFAVAIEGDSMEPKFLHGDRVVLEPSNQPVSGKPVVARFVDDSVQLRIYFKMPSGRIRLAPINPIYPTLEHKPSEFTWIFPVAELNRSIF